MQKNKGDLKMNNRDVCHNFFYQTGEYFDKSYMTVSYNNDIFYSYYTAIARKITGLNGQEYLLISNNNMTPTTSKHINYLRSACPHNNIIYVPQRYGHHYMELDTIINDIKENIKYYADSKLTQKPNRESFTKYYNMLNRINEEIQKTDTTLLDTYKSLYDDINDPIKLKQIKQIQAAKQAEIRQKLKEELHELLHKYDLPQLAQMAYSSYPHQYKEHKESLKKYLNQNNDLSFIWFDGEYCKTSQGIRVNRADVEKMLKLWKLGKVKQGMKIDYYTVLSVQDDFVKIGCHKIPVTNLEALYNNYIIKKVA